MTYLDAMIEAANRLKYLWFAEFLNERLNEQGAEKFFKLAADIYTSPSNSHKHGVSGKRHDLEWFLSHVGERVFRNKVKCDCESCKRGGDEGVFITDKTHAKYLFDVQNELGIRYHAACADTKGGENG